MPQKSGFFDTTADDPREYPAREFAEYFARFVGNGVFSGGTKLKVTATGNDANVKVDLGYAWINGYMYSVFDTPLTLPIAPATTQDRIDRIILRLDTSTPVRAVQAMVIQGLPNASPTPPSIIRSGDIYDLSLAQVRIKANSSIVLPENITDERLNNTVCGLVTGLVQQADTTTIFNQFQSWLNTKTAEYQQQWQDFLKGVQDEGFATTQYVDDRVLHGGYGITTNSGNAYIVRPNPAPTALVEGLRITVKVNAANTGAATINVNGLGTKSILRGNGTALIAGSLKANSVYTLVYNGSAFILQGEGGEYGTATAADVLVPKTIGTDNGIVTGTMPNRSAENNHMPGLEKTAWAGDRYFIRPPAGYYNGSTWVTAAEPQLTANNLRNGADVGGIIGTLIEGRPYIQGTIVVPSNSSLIVPVSFQPLCILLVQGTGSGATGHGQIFGWIRHAGFSGSGPALRYLYSSSDMNWIGTTYSEANGHIYISYWGSWEYGGTWNYLIIAR
ncbi:hypothetical protein [Paenibacillus sp. FSL W8-1287]|uniref:hypothetical protein n=1 Tax=Paenibacillus sp. FSL W8-1287 TaxID=2954653 RepID=UPI0030CED63E